MRVTSKHVCRLCKTELPVKPVLELRNVPKGAQYLPRKESCTSDTGVRLAAYECEYCALIQLSGEQVIYVKETTSATCYSPAIIEHRYNQAQMFINRFGLSGKKVLDVGCGDGNFVKLLGMAGALALGIEPSDKAKALGVEQGLKIFSGYATKSSQIPGAPYDGFTCIHVMEHVPDINDFLQGIHAALTPQGVGLLEVPSTEQILERKRFYDFLPDHLNYFTLDTLQLAVEKNGFNVLETIRDWSGEHIAAVIRKRQPSALLGVQNAVEGMRKQMDGFVQAYQAQGKKVAIWGASYQAVCLLSLVGSKGISFVIDSAHYKQGRFMPISHLPIVGPEMLKISPVDVILVLAPRFSTEIIDQLTSDLRFGGIIAELKGANIEIIQGA